MISLFIVGYFLKRYIVFLWRVQSHRHQTESRLELDSICDQIIATMWSVYLHILNSISRL